MSIVVNTPTGHIGSRVVDLLLAAGEKVTVLHRDPEKVRHLADRGVRVVQGSIDDPAAVGRALEGAEALFWVTPPPARPDFLAWAVEAGKNAAVAARSHGIRRAVVLSSTGAHNGRHDLVGILRDVEDAFRSALSDVTVLRPGYFMENLLSSVETLAQGALYQICPGDMRVPTVATRDIGDKAAGALLDRGWSGHRILGVHGPEDLSHDEIAAILSEELGRPVGYVELPIDQFREGLLSEGLPPFVADLLTELYDGARNGYLDPAEPRTAEITTPTSLRTFVREVLRPAVESVAVPA